MACSGGTLRVAFDGADPAPTHSDVFALAATHFPPCMRRLVEKCTGARGERLKYSERVAFIPFLYACGLGRDDVARAYLALCANDREHRTGVSAHTSVEHFLRTEYGQFVDDFKPKKFHESRCSTLADKGLCPYARATSDAELGDVVQGELARAYGGTAQLVDIEDVHGVLTHSRSCGGASYGARAPHACHTVLMVDAQSRASERYAPRRASWYVRVREWHRSARERKRAGLHPLRAPWHFARMARALPVADADTAADAAATPRARRTCSGAARAPRAARSASKRDDVPGTEEDPMYVPSFPALIERAPAAGARCAHLADGEHRFYWNVKPFASHNNDAKHTSIRADMSGHALYANRMMIARGDAWSKTLENGETTERVCKRYRVLCCSLQVAEAIDSFTASAHAEACRWFSIAEKGRPVALYLDLETPDMPKATRGAQINLLRPRVRLMIAIMRREFVTYYAHAALAARARGDDEAAERDDAVARRMGAVLAADNALGTIAVFEACLATKHSAHVHVPSLVFGTTCVLNRLVMRVHARIALALELPDAERAAADPLVHALGAAHLLDETVFTSNRLFRFPRCVKPNRANPLRPFLDVVERAAEHPALRSDNTAALVRVACVAHHTPEIAALPIIGLPYQFLSTPPPPVGTVLVPPPVAADGAGDAGDAGREKRARDGGEGI